MMKKAKIALWTAALCVLGSALQAASHAVPAANVRHGVAVGSADRFAGWPANEGSWAWGDEILVGFEGANYLAQSGDHSLDRTTASLGLARSTDDAKTWESRDIPQFGPPVYLEDPSRTPGGAIPHGGQPQTCPGIDDMTARGFAMKLRGDSFFVSQDKGAHWSGPYAIPYFEVDGATVIPGARTQYIVTGPKSALVFMSSVGARTEGEKAERGRAYVMRTDDGCKSFQFVGWMGPDLEPQASAEERKFPVFSIMPSVVQIGGGHYVAALRQRIHKRKWTDIFESKDDGKTWHFVAKAESGANNPPALVRLNDGRLALVYGWRGKKMGVRARLSDDNGRTWPDEFILRDDALTWDLGYPRAHVLDNGDVLALYYYNTREMPQQHIAFTRWTPPARR